MIYEKPEAQIVLFDNSDVITASGGCPTHVAQDYDWCRKIFVFIDCLGSGYNFSRRQSHNSSPAGPNEDPFANM